MVNSGEDEKTNETEDSQEEPLRSNVDDTSWTLNNKTMTIFIVFSVIFPAFCQLMYLYLLDTLKLSLIYDYIIYFFPLLFLVAILDSMLLCVKYYSRILEKLSRLIRSKFYLLIFLIVLNIFLFIAHFTFFIYNRYPIVIENDGYLTFMARFGLSWLYILPYNFILSFPLFISMYSQKFKYPE